MEAKKILDIASGQSYTLAESALPCGAALNVNVSGKSCNNLMHSSTSLVARFLVVSLLVGCLSLAFLVPSIAQDAKTEKSAPGTGSTSAPPASTKLTPAEPPVQPTPPASPTSPTVNPVTQAAVQAGVLFCASRINQVLTFLTGNTKSSAYLFTPQKQPDQSIFSVSLGLEGQNAAGAYASASFAPTTSGQAAAVYDTVQYVAQSAADVEKSVFKNLKRKGTLGKDIIMLDGGAVTVFLMPAGSGCVVIKKEVVQ